MDMPLIFGNYCKSLLPMEGHRLTSSLAVGSASLTIRVRSCREIRNSVKMSMGGSSYENEGAAFMLSRKSSREKCNTCTVNRHRWIGREYQGARDNSG